MSLMEEVSCVLGVWEDLKRGERGKRAMVRQSWTYRSAVWHSHLLWPWEFFNTDERGLEERLLVTPWSSVLWGPVELGDFSSFTDFTFNKSLYYLCNFRDVLSWNSSMTIGYEISRNRKGWKVVLKWSSRGQWWWFWQDIRLRRRHEGVLALHEPTDYESSWEPAVKEVETKGTLERLCAWHKIIALSKLFS